jgi:hypothetical protein
VTPVGQDGAIQVTDEGGRKLTWRWAFFFLALAVLNEIDRGTGQAPRLSQRSRLTQPLPPPFAQLSRARPKRELRGWLKHQLADNLNATGGDKRAKLQQGGLALCNPARLHPLAVKPGA